MTREDAAMKLSFHLMQCGLLMPIGWINNNGDGSELFRAVRMAQDALRERSDGCSSCDGGFGDNTLEFAELRYKFCPYCGRKLEE